MRTSTIVAGLLSLAGAFHGLSVDTMELMESLRTVPEGWHQVGAPEASRRLHFRIAVTQPNQALFEQTLLDISTPSHPRYGQHMKRDELKSMLRPSFEATESIMDWLSTSGIQTRDIQDDGEWINFVATVAQAEEMLSTRFHNYRNSIRPIERIRTLHYSVPAALHKHIDMIQPTTRFGQIRPERSQILDTKVIGKVGTGLNVTACNATITPECLQDLYNIRGFRANPEKGGFVGVTGFLEEYARYADLAAFEAEYAPYAIGQNFTWTSINGGLLDQTSSESSIEANLDIQYAVSLSYPLRNNFYSTAGRGPLIPDLDQPSQENNQNEPYLDLLTYLVSLPDGELPHTLTTSYGEDEQSVPEQYSRTVCNLFGQLGARGVSVLFASGDTGVGSACQTNDGRNTTRFLPIFPAACPTVTSVGGTFQVQPERAIYFSSGGFSDRFPRPAYQDAAVERYLSILGDRWEGLYNPEGRGFPDVAAQSFRYHVIDKGLERLVSGTSASAPTFAAIVALLNAARLQSNKPPLGFLNPWIYSVGYQGLTDIVDGGSTGCTGTDQYSGLPTPFVPYASWNATQGWDPVTGYGTPNFGKLLRLANGGRYGYGGKV